MVELRAAHERIEPIRQPLIDAHHAAAERWHELLTESPHLALPLDARARANFIHPHVCSEVERRVANFDGVEPTDCLEFFALKLAPEILLRFKFLGVGVPSNVATGRQRLLARQMYSEEMTMALGIDPPPTLLTCGYTLDGAAIGRIEIRRDCKGQLPWSYALFGDDAVVEPLPLDGMADATKPATVRSSTAKPEEGQARSGSA